MFVFQSDIEAATVAVKQALHVCNKFRRKHSMISLTKPNYDSYTAGEFELSILLCAACSLQIYHFVFGKLMVRLISISGLQLLLCCLFFFYF